MIKLIRLYKVKAFSLQCFVPPATESCKLLKKHCTKILINSTYTKLLSLNYYTIRYKLDVKSLKCYKQK